MSSARRSDALAHVVDDSELSLEIRFDEDGADVMVLAGDADSVRQGLTR